jgi:hypothetical protein
VCGSGLDDPGVLEVRRIIFAADLLNKSESRLHRILKVKNLNGPVVKAVDSILLGLF